jgi:ribosomal protein S27AE
MKSELQKNILTLEEFAEKWTNPRNVLTRMSELVTSDVHKAEFLSDLNIVMENVVKNWEKNEKKQSRVKKNVCPHCGSKEIYGKSKEQMYCDACTWTWWTKK